MKIFTSLLSLIFIVQFSMAQCWQKIASKQDHVIAINVDGTLWNWGGALGAHRLLAIPAILDSSNNWIDIAAGNQFYAALKSDGTLWTWGENSGGQLGSGSTTNTWAPSMIGTDSNWVKVSCGDGHMVAIKSDGTLWIWGRNNYGQLGKGTNRTNVLIPEQLGTDSNWVDVSAGKNHTLIKKSDNSLWFVGACYNTSLVSQLWKIGSTNDWACMSGGSFTDYAIKLNGELWTWNNSNGKNTAPVKVGNQNDWLKVDNSHTYSPEYHALFLKTDASLWAIGNNFFGQLGNSTTVNQSGVPIKIGTENDWRDIVAGSYYSFGLKNDNSFYAWGRNQHAQFGNGENKNTIKAINNSIIWKEMSSSVASYNGHTLAIQNNGTLWAWGQNNDGQLGNGSTYTHHALPLKVGNDSNWFKVTNGFHFSIAVKEDGTLWAWGRNSRRQLGLAGSTFNRTTPVSVNNDSNWVDISAGAEFVIALKNNGTLWAWGYNYDGQLGDGTSNTLETPTQIGSDTNWIAISAGHHHSMGLKADSTLWTWGSNQHGQLGRGGNTRIPTQVGEDKWTYIAAGGLHSIGIKADSTLWAWGRNLYAQLGDNSTSNKSTPTKIGNDSTWVSVSAGYEHSLGIQADSTLWGWGRSAHGQLGDTATYHHFLAKTYVPTKVYASKNWKKIDGGAVNSIALNTDGTLFTFGDSYVADSQMNFPQLGYVYNTPVLIYSCASCTTSSQINWHICSSDSVFFNGHFLSNAGVYYDTLINAAGCDSIIEFNLIVSSLYEFTQTENICFGNTLQWRGNSYSTQGIYYDSLVTVYGCDSVYILDLTVNPFYYFVETESICTGDTITWRGQTYWAGGIYFDSLLSVTGCDSVYALNLSEFNVYNYVTYDSICQGGNYTWQNNVYAITGTYYNSFTSQFGCDSTYVLHLFVAPIHSIVHYDTICNGDIYNWQGNNYTTGGFYYAHLQTTNGCDSVLALALYAHSLSLVSISIPDTFFCDYHSPVFITGTPAGGTFSGQGVSSNIFNPESAGIGTWPLIYTYTDSNACENTATISVVVDACVGISENKNNKLKLYPNPNDGRFFIELSEDTHVLLYNALGALIYNNSFVKGTHALDFPEIPAGVYFLRVEGKNNSEVVRVVVWR